MFEPGYAIGWKYSSDLNLLVNPPPFWWLNLHDWCLDTVCMYAYYIYTYIWEPIANASPRIMKEHVYFIIRDCKTL